MKKTSSGLAAQILSEFEDDELTGPERDEIAQALSFFEGQESSALRSRIPDGYEQELMRNLRPKLERKSWTKRLASFLFPYEGSSTRLVWSFAATSFAVGLLLVSVLNSMNQNGAGSAIDQARIESDSGTALVAQQLIEAQDEVALRWLASQGDPGEVLLAASLDPVVLTAGLDKSQVDRLMDNLSHLVDGSSSE